MNNSEYFDKISDVIKDIDMDKLWMATKVIAGCRKLYIFGNGGSAAIANHWVCDFAKGINEDTTRTANAESLCSNVPLITAIANDIGYEYIFSKQLEYSNANHLDCAVAISSSGNSKNVIEGLKKANSLNLTTISFTGFGGGAAAVLSGINVHVNSDNYGVVEDMHMMMLHSISQKIRFEYARDLNTLKL